MFTLVRNTHARALCFEDGLDETVVKFRTKYLLFLFYQERFFNEEEEEDADEDKDDDYEYDE